MSFNFYYDNVKFRLRESTKIKSLLQKVIREEKRIPGDLNFIFTNDDRLLDININFLKHDYYTDVITFDYCEGNIITGEIYISIDRVRGNANNYKVSLKSEVLRVIIHGVLHLCGYDDNSEEGRNDMRKHEEFWLEEYLKG